MPRFTPNPLQATVGFPVYPPGMYEMAIKEMKPFLGQPKDGKEPNYGLRAICTIRSGEHSGKTFVANLYQHTEGARNFSKAFVVCAYGFTPTEEGNSAFNDFLASQGLNDDSAWEFDTDVLSLGEGWRNMVGKVIMVELDVEKSPSGNPQNKATYYPVA